MLLNQSQEQKLQLTADLTREQSRCNALSVECEQAHKLTAELTRELSAVTSSLSWRCLHRIKMLFRRGRQLGGIRFHARQFREVLFLKRSGMFCDAWYLSRNPDVGEALKTSFAYRIAQKRIPGVSKAAKYFSHPIRHYVRFGAKELRNPNPDFSTGKYYEEHPELLSSGENPFVHFLNSTKFSVGTPLPPTSTPVSSAIALRVRPYYPTPASAGDGTLPAVRVGVHLYLAFVSPAIADLLVEALHAVTAPFDLIISVAGRPDESEIARFTKRLPAACHVVRRKCPSHRGAMTELHRLWTDCSEQYDLFGQIAVNGSMDDDALSCWTRQLRTMFAGHALPTAFRLLAADGKIVFPAATGIFADDGMGYGNDRDAVEKFAAALGFKISVGTDDVCFPAAGMFFCTAAALNSLFEGKEKTIKAIPEEVRDAVLLKTFLIGINSLPGWCYRFFSDDICAGRSDYEPSQEDFSGTPKKYKKIRLLSFYLPQFHPTPENDRWHGKGFTEWTSVRSAEPLFEGHYQQRLPHDDIGFYMLDNPGILKQQADMMHRSGVYGQIFYHYWFTGKLILEKPAQMLLDNPEIDMPFCFCWANENWTKRWDGNESEILLEQRYSASDARKFLEYLLPFFRDPRYIRINGRPVLYIYRATAFPDFGLYREEWKRVCAENGLPELYLVTVLTRGAASPTDYGMDAGVERVLHDWTDGKVAECKQALAAYEPMTGSVLNYGEVAAHYSAVRAPGNFRFLRSIVPQWDNTARYKNGALLLHGSSPSLFGGWLEHLIAESEHELPQEECFLVVNAWNEWAEGAYLEPDKRFGYAYLNTIGRVLTGRPHPDGKRESGTPAMGPIRVQIDRRMASDRSAHTKFLWSLRRLAEKNELIADPETFKLLNKAVPDLKPDQGIQPKYRLIFEKNVFFQPEAVLTMLQCGATHRGAAIVGNFFYLNAKNPLVLTERKTLANDADLFRVPVRLVPETGIRAETYWCAEAQFLLTDQTENSAAFGDDVSTIIRFHRSGNLKLLRNALSSLICQEVEVSVHLCVQDPDKALLAELEKLFLDFPWSRGKSPVIHSYFSTPEQPDLRAFMLCDGLKQVKTRFAAFLDYDDMLFPCAYRCMAERLRETGKTITFGRVYETFLSRAENRVLSRNPKYENGSNYADFYFNNFAPIHSFLLDVSQIDFATLTCRPGMKYMEDYYLLLQIVSPDNSDFEPLRQNPYYGDYMRYVDDSINTLACDKPLEEWLRDPLYRKCQEAVDNLRKSIADSNLKNKKKSA